MYLAKTGNSYALQLGMAKQNNGVLLSNKKIYWYITIIWISNVNSKWKLDSKGYIAYDSIYMTCWKRQNYKDGTHFGLPEIKGGEGLNKGGRQRNFLEGDGTVCSELTGGS